MPSDSSTGYIPLDGSRIGCWVGRTPLEKRLLFLSIILAVVVFALSLAFALKGCAEHPSNSTTVSPPTTLAPSPTAAPTSLKPNSTVHSTIVTTTPSLPTTLPIANLTTPSHNSTTIAPHNSPNPAFHNSTRPVAHNSTIAVNHNSTTPTAHNSPTPTPKNSTTGHDKLEVAESTKKSVSVKP